MKYFWIIGGGKTGITLSVYLNSLGIPVFLSEKTYLNKDDKNILNKHNIPFEEGKNSIDKAIAEAKIVILSPGIPLSQSMVQKFFYKGTEVISEIECLTRIHRHLSYISITGSYGKSTLTQMLSCLLNSGGISSIPCGNFGYPLSQALQEKGKEHIFITELSSYQLETSPTIAPQISVFLNFSENHLERYETLQAYFLAKWRLILQTQKVVLVHSHVWKIARELGCPMPSCHRIIIQPTLEEQQEILISRNRLFDLKSEYKELKKIPLPGLPTQESWGFLDIQKDKVTLFSRDAELHEEISLKHPKVHLSHNKEHLGIAIGISRILGLEKKWIETKLPTLEDLELPHRLELIEKDPITIINDSKSTSVESTLVALQSYQDHPSLYLMLGGKKKEGQSFQKILIHQNKIQKIILFGESRHEIHQEIIDLKDKIEVVTSLKEAIPRALSLMPVGSLLLFSPGCASYDEFESFEHRGDVFKKMVQSSFSRKNMGG